MRRKQMSKKNEIVAAIEEPTVVEEVKTTVEETPKAEGPTAEEIALAIAYLKTHPKAIKSVLADKEKAERVSKHEAMRKKFAPMCTAVSREVSMALEAGWCGRIVFDFSENATSPEINVKTRIDVAGNGKVIFRKVYNSTKTARTRSKGNGGAVRVIMAGHRLENQEFASTQALAVALNLPENANGPYNALRTAGYNKGTFWAYVGK